MVFVFFEAGRRHTRLASYRNSDVFSSDLEVDAHTSRLVSAYLMVLSHGIWPVDGGLLDQAAAFVAAVRLMDAEKGRIELARAEKQRRKQEAASRRASARR